ncbi:hypothetical protein HPT25_28040 [Bacillus sp. BRMEA1]|uniref:hypothetical protein n=1 Tax=Neobacillus endophyticus TaxID=2738405 RepID=UPI001566B376|nr:hypothetical protein [Neobacillus endophyticus]NRD81146.1 hypothetical protein [Neobacillus endophyticus]
MNKKYDWKKVEAYFMNAGFESRLSLMEIGLKFNIPYQSVRRYAAAHDWHNRRYRAWVKEKNGVSFEEHVKALRQQVMNRG